jgi:20S proteasome subunit alpha 2
MTGNKYSYIHANVWYIVSGCSVLLNDRSLFWFYRYSEDLELDDAVHTAILTLKEGFEGQMTADNIEVGICDAQGFRRLDPSNVKDYLANIP